MPFWTVYVDAAAGVLILATYYWLVLTGRV
jgi:hypothetical protein